METTLTLQSIITCPNCGFQKEETVPTDACQYFYKCTNCETTLKSMIFIIKSYAGHHRPGL